MLLFVLHCLLDELTTKNKLTLFEIGSKNLNYNAIFTKASTNLSTKHLYIFLSFILCFMACWSVELHYQIGKVIKTMVSCSNLLNSGGYFFKLLFWDHNVKFFRFSEATFAFTFFGFETNNLVITGLYWLSG